ncbi:hypothetical protein GCM10010407_15930 [Rarobacter incanus]
MSTVARRLGLTKGAFAYHFPTKKSIADALADAFDVDSRKVKAAADTIYPDQPAHAFVLYLIGLGHHLAADPITRASATLAFDLTSPVENSKAIIATFREPVQDYISRIGEKYGTTPKRGYDLVSEAVTSLLIGQNFVSTRSERPVGVERFRTIRIILDMAGLADTDEIVKEVAQASVKNPDFKAPVYKRGVLTLADPDADSA